MSFTEFINRFDTENSIILLEGKRKVLDEDKGKLTQLANLLIAKTFKMIFRSGNAESSDQLFSDPISLVDNKRLQVITPYTGHRQKITVLIKLIL